MEQVKGVTYSLRGFIGGDLGVTDGPADPTRHLYHIILYLAPGDYHRFHAPADVAIHERRYFPGTYTYTPRASYFLSAIIDLCMLCVGDLLSVSPAVARLVKGLFNYNERVVLLGEWAHGMLAYAAVGAYNVGSVVIRGDDELKTNQRGVSYTPGEYRDKEWKGGYVSPFLPPLLLHTHCMWIAVQAGGQQGPGARDIPSGEHHCPGL